jgi:heme-degrading monooxygenase HmoA
MTTEQAASAWLKAAESEAAAQSSTHTALAVRFRHRAFFYDLFEKA